MSGKVLVERSDIAVALTLSHPERRNALSFEMYDALEREFERVAADPGVRALVLRGDGGAFAGGTDIRHLAEITTGDEGVAYEAHMRRVQEGLLALRVPVISIVDGACVGGGLVLAALSDIVFCTPRSRFGSPIARTLGNTLSATSLARLRQLAGPRRTSEMLLTGRLLSAVEAEDCGLVTAVVEDAEMEVRLRDTLEAIAGCAPLTLKSFKELERRIDAAVAAVETADVYREIYGSADFREGVDAFLNKRPARFEGR
jgi:enoyl-CoA hydratase